MWLSALTGRESCRLASSVSTSVHQIWISSNEWSVSWGTLGFESLWCRPAWWGTSHTGACLIYLGALCKRNAGCNSWGKYSSRCLVTGCWSFRIALTMTHTASRWRLTVVFHRKVPVQNSGGLLWRVVRAFSRVTKWRTRGRRDGHRCRTVRCDA